MLSCKGNRRWEILRLTAAWARTDKGKKLTEFGIIRVEYAYLKPFFIIFVSRMPFKNLKDDLRGGQMVAIV